MWRSARDGAIVMAMQRAILLALFMTAPVARSSEIRSRVPTPAADSTFVIHARMMLDGRGGGQRNIWVVVKGTRIELLSASPVAVAGARTIELGSATLLPGLIDAHVHPGWYVDRQGKRNSQRSGDTPAQAVLARAGNLYATLMAGVTTIQ